MAAGAYQRLLDWSEAGGHHLSADRSASAQGEAWSITLESGVLAATGIGDTIDGAAQKVIEHLRMLGVAFAEGVPGTSGVVDHLRVDYPGSWSASFGGISEAGQTVEGRGTKTFEVKDPTVVGVFTKTDGGSGRITVQLLSGSTVVKEESTTDSLLML